MLGFPPGFFYYGRKGSRLWTLLSSSRDGERVTETFQATVPGGVLYRNVTSYVDSATGKVKVVSESMVITGSGGSPPVSPILENEYNEVSGVQPNVETDVQELPFAFRSYLHRVEVSGNNSAIYSVYINDVKEAMVFVGNTGPFVHVFDFSAGSAGKELEPGDTITVTALQTNPAPGTFTSRIFFAR